MNPLKIWIASLAFLVVFAQFWFADAYDPLDPNGNVTVRWDFLEAQDRERYYIMVSILNYQLYRHFEPPGWKLGWTWPSDSEAIRTMSGAEAILQGNCSHFHIDPLPHSCERNPVIVDLLPGAPYNIQTANCCRGGVLASLTQDPSKSISSFQMDILSSNNFSDPRKRRPYNFTIGVPGYTCSNATLVAPSQFRSEGSRHVRQALMTWKVVCSYSQFRESSSPGCCVSLSTFYNDTIVSCPRCSCSCQGADSMQKCYRDDQRDSVLQMPHSDDDDIAPPVVTCTHHMCPIRVHWHVKVSYKEYWRVKVTITNFNMLKNYSDWNLVVEHPNLQSLMQVFSFNYRSLVVYPSINNTGMFWGIPYYNTMLLQEGESGNVQSEMILHKDPGEFTFNAGWVFPRRILFNGHQCVMPSPEMYPALPSGRVSAACLSLSLDLFLVFSSVLLFVVFLLV